jgi:hypothetical protein
MAKKKKTRVTLDKDPVRLKIRESKKAARKYNTYLITAISVGVAGLATLWFFAARERNDPEYEFQVALQQDETVSINEVLPPSDEAPRGRVVFTIKGKRVEAPVKNDKQAALREGDRVHVFYRQGEETKTIRVETWLPAEEEPASDAEAPPAPDAGPGADDP